MIESSGDPITLHVIKRPIVFDELNAIFAADCQPALAAWTILVHASRNNIDLPMDIIFKENGMKVKDKKGQWNLHPVVGDRRLLKVTGVCALSDADSSTSMKLICPLRDALDVRLTGLQRSELNLPQDLPGIPLSVFTPLMCRYLRHRQRRIALFDHLVMDQAAPLVFELKESERMTTSSHQQMEDIQYWRFELPYGSVPLMEMVRNKNGSYV